MMQINVVINLYFLLFSLSNLKELRFHLPLSLAALSTGPILMIGTGSRISPFRGFWQKMMMDTLNPSIQKNVIDDFSSIELKRDSQNMFPEDAFGDADLTSVVIFIGCRDNNHNLLEHATKPCKNVPTRSNSFSREANLSNQYVSDIIKP